jgi:hypothetical protein
MGAPVPIVVEPPQIEDLLALKEPKPVVRDCDDVALNLQNATNGDRVSCFHPRLQRRHLVGNLLRLRITPECKFPNFRKKIINDGDPRRHDAGSESTRLVAGDSFPNMASSLFSPAAYDKFVKIPEAHWLPPSAQSTSCCALQGAGLAFNGRFP